MRFRIQNLDPSSGSTYKMCGHWARVKCGTLTNQGDSDFVVTQGQHSFSQHQGANSLKLRCVQECAKWIFLNAHRSEHSMRFRMPSSLLLVFKALFPFLGLFIQINESNFLSFSLCSNYQHQDVKRGQEEFQQSHERLCTHLITWYSCLHLQKVRRKELI